MNKKIKKTLLVFAWVLIMLIFAILAKKFPSQMGFPIVWASLVGWYGRKLWERI